MRRLVGSDMATHGFVIGDRGRVSRIVSLRYTPHLFAKKSECTRYGDEISNSSQRERLSIKEAYWTLLRA